ncbi:MAG: TolC family protein, partial [Bacteroidaceae bacterium]|nr:TolC family protein [Bacteroidaceae bacterium]
IQKDVTELQFQLTEKEVTLKVTECFWQLANVKYNLQTIEAAEKQLDAIYEQVSQYVKAGVSTRNDLLKISIRKQELQSNRLKLENAQHVLTLLLSQQIGLSNSNIDIDISESSVALPTIVDSQNATESREELKMANKNIEASKMQIKMERGKNLPTFAIGLMGFHSGMGGISDNVSQNINTTMTNGVVFGTLSIPISSWFGGTHAIKRQKIKLQQAENDYLDAKENLRIDIESSWANVIEAYKQIDIAQTTVEQTEENLRIYTDQYKAGVQNLTDLLDAETLNRQAHDNLSQAKANYQIKLCDYRNKTSNSNIY